MLTYSRIKPKKMCCKKLPLPHLHERFIEMKKGKKLHISFFPFNSVINLYYSCSPFV